MKKIFFLLSIVAMMTSCATKKITSHYKEINYPNTKLDKNTPNREGINVQSLVGAGVSYERKINGKVSYRPIKIYLYEESNIDSEEETVGGVIYHRDFLSGKEFVIHFRKKTLYIDGPLKGQPVPVLDVLGNPILGEYKTEPLFAQITSLEGVNLKKNTADVAWVEFGNGENALRFTFTSERFTNSNNYYLKIVKLADIKMSVSDLSKRNISVDDFGNLYVFQNGTIIYFIVDDVGNKYTISKQDALFMLPKSFISKGIQDDTETIILDGKEIGESKIVSDSLKLKK